MNKNAPQHENISNGFLSSATTHISVVMLQAKKKTNKLITK